MGHRGFLRGQGGQRLGGGVGRTRARVEAVLTRTAALLVLLLAGCNTPGPGSGYPAPVVVQVEGSTFRVYHDKLRAVAIRINPDFSPRAGRIFPRARRAMEEASGCRVLPATMQGDTTMIRADLICG